MFKGEEEIKPILNIKFSSSAHDIRKVSPYPDLNKRVTFRDIEGTECIANKAKEAFIREMTY